jgi:hypothetical protein
MTRSFARLLVVPVAAAASMAAHAAGHTLANARLSFTFGDTAVYAFANNDRVDAISWTDSSGTVRGGYVANGGPSHCGDPQEFFGQSYGEPEGNRPYAVISGEANTWTPTSAIKGSTRTSLTGFCDTAPDVVTTSAYLLSTKASRINELKVTRAFLFNAGSPVYTAHGLRAYVPRLPASTHATVLAPNAAGTAINTFNSSGCGADCELTDWNQRWFADDDGAGSGVMVIRAATSTAPALLAINNDAFSASNLTSIVLIQPVGGWKAKVVEIEYLCFYDPLSWTAAMKAAGKMPKGCMGT